MSALQALAKADPYRQLAHALPAEVSEPRAWSDVGGFATWLTALAAATAREGVVHVDLALRLADWAGLGLEPAELVETWWQAWQRAEDAPGCTLLLEWAMDDDATAAEAAWRRVRRLPGVPLAGISLVVPTVAGGDWTRWQPLLRTVVESGGRWQAVLSTPNPAALAQALELEVARVVVASGLPNDPGLLAHLRAWRIPVVALPAALTALRPYRDAGLLLSVASDTPGPRPERLTAALEAASQAFHWRLDDLRAATARAIEAVWAEPAARFALARRVEAWRHRPLPSGPLASDPFAL